MSMGYCDGTCEYLERDKRHTCAKYNEKLAWIKYRGAVSCTAHEQCKQCQIDEWEQPKVNAAGRIGGEKQ
ncbi:hypothetical protein OBO34_14355 [Clostridiales Family XIII bacterium ASD5510]|uniref:Uncharacterized protein n=1 Tax=Hominibacterium faecale TaxID=2839743 RepID=A0A9J6QTQ6_9FIRM|nr:hypothetical protein [Hominibacterium faecale]MCU7379525.1 hypothetical protein [Hominibacterium faecale]